jgi:predicted phosphodiesterase
LATRAKAVQSKDVTRVFIPDSHGAHIDPAAEAAFLADLKRLAPDEIVMLGDHLDCGGIFTTHSRSYTNEMAESYEDDVAFTNKFLDAIHKAAPKARIWYVAGNHEFRVEKWATSTFFNKKDADSYLAAMGPAAALKLKTRGIRYIERNEFMPGCSIPGTLKLTVGGTSVYVTHGLSASAHAAAVHLSKFGANVVFGHIHRAVSVHGRSVDKGLFGAWSPGTLARIQPLYMHTNVSQWAHGYGLEVVSKSGRFIHINVPIVSGESMLAQVSRAIR